MQKCPTTRPLTQTHRSRREALASADAACHTRAVEHELRIYTLRRGTLEDFISAWRREVLPLRERFGFEVLGVWCELERSEFVWQLAYLGDEGLREGERRYGEARALLSFQHDPADYVEAVQVRFLQSVQPAPAGS